MREKAKPKPVVFVSKKDGSILRRFPSLEHAAQHLMVQPSDVKRRIVCKALSPLDYMVRFEDEWSGYERFKPGAYNRPIIAVSNGVIMWYSTAAKAADGLNYGRSMITYYAKRGKPLPNRIFIKYQNDTKEFKELVDLLNKKKELKCL